jgi:hypothetical protein
MRSWATGAKGLQLLMHEALSYWATSSLADTHAERHSACAPVDFHIFVCRYRRDSIIRPAAGKEFLFLMITLPFYTQSSFLSFMSSFVTRSIKTPTTRKFSLWLRDNIIDWNKRHFNLNRCVLQVIDSLWLTEESNIIPSIIDNHRFFSWHIPITTWVPACTNDQFPTASLPKPLTHFSSLCRSNRY